VDPPGAQGKGMHRPRAGIGNLGAGLGQPRFPFLMPLGGSGDPVVGKRVGGDPVVGKRVGAGQLLDPANWNTDYLVDQPFSS